MGDDLDDVRALLPGTTVTPIGVLGGSDRSALRRARVAMAGEPPTTVIVKTFAQQQTWARESAALTVLPAEAPSACLVAAGAKPPVVVMSDLGDGAKVADAMLGADPAEAATAILAWIDAIAALHRTTLGCVTRSRPNCDRDQERIGTADLGHCGAR
jgi:hypothetical protein